MSGQHLSNSTGTPLSIKFKYILAHVSCPHALLSFVHLSDPITRRQQSLPSMALLLTMIDHTQTPSMTVSYLVSSSLTSPFSTNMAISETNANQQVGLNAKVYLPKSIFKNYLEDTILYLQHTFLKYVGEHCLFSCGGHIFPRIVTKTPTEI